MGFLQDLANVLVGGFSELTQCTNFTQIITNAGNMEGMDEEEKNKIILDALKSCGAATTPDTLLGEVYPILEKKAVEISANLKQPTAHETCPARCKTKRSECGRCLKERLEIIDALNYAENPALYRQSASAQPPAAASNKCSLCGAPINQGASACDYCGTPVAGNAAGAVGVSSGFVPSSTMPPEQQAYELIYNHLQGVINEMNKPETRKAMINIQCAVAWSTCPTMSKAEILRITEQSANENLPLLKAKMSLSDLYFAAEYHHMSVTTYLRGLFNGDANLKTAAVIRQEENYARQREVREQNRELQRQADERRKQSEREFWERRQASYRPPQYAAGGGGGGGSRYCCGTCAHYMSGTNTCTEYRSNGPKSASDYCPKYMSR